MPRNNLQKLEAAQKQVIDSIPAADWQLWKASGPTKALLLQFEIDLEDLKDNWSRGGFSDDKEIKAQAQAEYISGVFHMINAFMKEREHEHED